jgi:hypothetical protein
LVLLKSRQGAEVNRTRRSRSLPQDRTSRLSPSSLLTSQIRFPTPWEAVSDPSGDNIAGHADIKSASENSNVGSDVWTIQAYGAFA